MLNTEFNSGTVIAFEIQERLPQQSVLQDANAELSFRRLCSNRIQNLCRQSTIIQ